MRIKRAGIATYEVATFAGGGIPQRQQVFVARHNEFGVDGEGQVDIVGVFRVAGKLKDVGNVGRHRGQLNERIEVLRDSLAGEFELRNKVRTGENVLQLIKDEFRDEKSQRLFADGAAGVGRRGRSPK